MEIKKQVTIGEQFGQISMTDDTEVNINLTNLKGQVKLAELEAVVRESRDLNRRINPPVIKKAKKKAPRRR